MILLEYPNVPSTIGTMLSLRLASLRDLDEHLSVEDVYDLLEVQTIDAHNQRLIKNIKQG